MAALREIFAYFGVKFDDKQLEQGDKAVKSTTKSLDKLDDQAKKTKEILGSLTSWLVGGAMVAGFANLVSGFVQSTRETNAWATSLRMSAQEMLGWQYVASRFGVSTDDLTSALKDLQVRAQDAVANGGSYAEAFRAIGISTADIRPIVNDTGALMELFADRMNSTTDSARQLFAVDELLGDAGIRMMPILRQGSQRMRQWRGEASRAGRDVTAVTEGMGRLTERVSALNLRWSETKNRLALSVMPTLEAFMTKAQPVLTWAMDLVPVLVDAVRNSNLLASALAIAGTAAALAWGPAAVSATLAIAPYLALGLALDEIITTARGGDSVIRHLMDHFFGAKRSAEYIRDLQEAIEGMSLAIVAAEERMRGFFGLTSRMNELSDPLQRQTAERNYTTGRNQYTGFQAATGTTGVWDFLRQTFGVTDWDRVYANMAEARGTLTPSGVVTAAGGQSVNVSAPTTMNVTINDASNPDDVLAAVDEAARAREAAILREVQRTLGSRR